MNRAPTRRELEVLRYLAVGMTLHHPAEKSKRYPVFCKGVEVIALAEETVAHLIDAGWVNQNFALTQLGRDVAEVKTFVRSFAEASR